MPRYDDWQDALEDHDYDFEAASEAYQADGGAPESLDERKRLDRAQTREFEVPEEARKSATEPRDLTGTKTGTKRTLASGHTVKVAPGEDTEAAVQEHREVCKVCDPEASGGSDASQGGEA